MEPENSFPFQFKNKMWNGNKLAYGNIMFVEFQEVPEKASSSLLPDLTGWAGEQDRKKSAIFCHV